MTSFERVGFIGLGDIGLPMMEALLRSGFDVAAYDLRPEALAKAVTAGARAVDDVDELGRTCDAVCIAVFDAPQLEAVASVLVETMRPGTTVLVHSSVLPSAVIAVADRLGVAGVRVIDAPVSGRRQAAIDQTLSVMVGADADLFGNVEHLLRAFGTPRLVGPVGSGQVVKVANNLIATANIVVVHEVLRITAAYGVDERVVREVLLSSSAASWMLEHWDDVMEGIFLSHRLAGTQAMVDFMGKEPWAAVVAGHEAGVHAPVLAMIAEALHPIFTARMATVREAHGLDLVS